MRTVFEVEEYCPELQMKFKSRSQALAWEVIENNQVTFLTGPAGTSKTFTAVAYALLGVYNRREYNNIVITRPLVDAGEDMGALPGDVGEKTQPFFQPIYDALDKVCPEQLKSKLKPEIEKVVKIRTIGHMRGLTFDNSVCVLDEAQNLTKSQMTMYLTRLGHGTKMIVAGDTEQSDIGKLSVLYETAQAQSRHAGVGWFDFTHDDVVRPRLVSLMAKTMQEI